jgi:ribosomal protein L37AE/L43A
MKKIIDYHDFSHRGTSVEKRKKLDIGEIYVNGAECHNCGYFIRSRNRHDLVECKCGDIAVDGGSWYAKRNFKKDANWTDIIENYDNLRKEKSDES